MILLDAQKMCQIVVHSFFFLLFSSGFCCCLLFSLVFCMLMRGVLKLVLFHININAFQTNGDLLLIVCVCVCVCLHVSMHVCVHVWWMCCSQMLYYLTLMANSAFSLFVHECCTCTHAHKHTHSHTTVIPKYKNKLQDIFPVFGKPWNQFVNPLYLKKSCVHIVTSESYNKVNPVSSV